MSVNTETSLSSNIFANNVEKLSSKFISEPDSIEKYMARNISSDYDYKRVEYPSVSPSFAPTSMPISIETQKKRDGLIEGCDGVDVKTLDPPATRNAIFFDYEMVLANTTNVTEAVGSLESSILTDLAKQFLSCPNRRNLRRFLQDDADVAGEGGIIQLESEPIDEIDDNQVECSSATDLNNNEACYPMKGAMIFHSTCTSPSCPSSEILSLGSAIKKGCDEDKYVAPLIHKVHFIGDRIQVAAVIGLNNQINADGGTPPLNMMFGFVIGVLIAGIASYLTAMRLYKKKRRDDDEDEEEDEYEYEYDEEKEEKESQKQKVEQE